MSDLEPEIQRRGLPAEVARLRFVVRRQQAELDAQMQPLLDAHIEVYAAAIETLIATHRELADGWTSTSRVTHDGRRCGSWAGGASQCRASSCTTSEVASRLRRSEACARSTKRSNY